MVMLESYFCQNCTAYLTISAKELQCFGYHMQFVKQGDDLVRFGEVQWSKMLQQMAKGDVKKERAC